MIRQIRHPMYSRGNIYLSGGMEYAENDGAGWRADVSRRLKSQGYFPLDISELDEQYDITHGNEFNELKNNDDEQLRRKAILRKQFIETDLQLIKNDTDALIVYYDESARRGAGTISECQYAFLLDKPIFIVSAWEDWQNQVPGWLFALSTKVFTNFDDTLDYMQELPYGILKDDVYGNKQSNGQYLCSLSGEPFQKSKHQFVSKVSPLYNKESVNIVADVHEEMKSRYQFFVEYVSHQIKLGALR